MTSIWYSSIQVDVRMAYVTVLPQPRESNHPALLDANSTYFCMKQIVLFSSFLTIYINLYVGEDLGISTGSTRLDGFLSSLSKGEYSLQREIQNQTTKHQVVCNTERCEPVLLPMEQKSSEQKLKFKHTSLPVLNLLQVSKATWTS